MTIQTELRRLAGEVVFTCVHKGTLNEAASEIDRLKRRVNELARVVLALKSSARFAEAAGVNTEPEA